MLTLGCGILERYDATGWPNTLFWKKELHAWSNDLVKCLKLAIFFEIPKPTYFFFHFGRRPEHSLQEKKICVQCGLKWETMKFEGMWVFRCQKLRQTDLQHFAIISSSINLLFLINFFLHDVSRTYLLLLHNSVVLLNW